MEDYGKKFQIEKKANTGEKKGGKKRQQNEHGQEKNNERKSRKRISIARKNAKQYGGSNRKKNKRQTRIKVGVDANLGLGHRLKTVGSNGQDSTNEKRQRVKCQKTRGSSVPTDVKAYTVSRDRTWLGYNRNWCVASNPQTMTSRNYMSRQTEGETKIKKKSA